MLWSSALVAKNWLSMYYIIQQTVLFFKKKCMVFQFYSQNVVETVPSYLPLHLVSCLYPFKVKSEINVYVQQRQRFKSIINIKINYKLTSACTESVWCITQ